MPKEAPPDEGSRFLEEDVLTTTFHAQESYTLDCQKNPLSWPDPKSIPWRTAILNELNFHNKLPYPHNTRLHKTIESFFSCLCTLSKPSIHLCDSIS